MSVTDLSQCQYLSEEDMKVILKNSSSNCYEYVLKEFSLHSASNKLLGFMSDHWRLKVLIQNAKESELLYFVKAISRTNEGKAAMATEMKVFDKETHFYSTIKQLLYKQDIAPWSANYVTSLKGTIVMEDLNVHQYKVRNIFKTFDKAHTLQALKTLARFHGSCIIFEEQKSKASQKVYRINSYYEKYLDKGGYEISNPWFVQCMTSTLKIVKMFSKYNKHEDNLKKIEERWKSIWMSALQLCDSSQKYRNVICHRDLWNNNLLFHYNGPDVNEPDDCVFVDFQAIRSQPLTGDIMMLLYCNLETEFRENNINEFLIYYYTELTQLLAKNEIVMKDILSWESFIESAKEQRLWGVVVSACIMPTAWFNEELAMKFFKDDTKFDDIFTINKAYYIKQAIETDEIYAAKILLIFDEIIERYCLDINKENIISS